ncbi:MAG: dTDP-4-dehydrorhamnose reductase [Clostridiales bacterium]|nr:dTDP-4-dehydrorhamnose reductase [Clostridiales bacterium]
MKKIFITGALGQLGRAIYGLLKDDPQYQLYLTDFHTVDDGLIKVLDITDEESVKAMISDFMPDIIINCAAMTAVDLCETEQEKAYKINSLGPKYLAFSANEIGAKMIHVSTDYVYDGQAGVPYTEESETSPLSVYGKTKLAGDDFVLKSCPKALVVRTAWVYGEGKNFVKTMLRLADEGKNIRVVADQIGTPTSALELARAIIFLMNTHSYGIYHATCEGYTTWYEFAVNIFKLAGKDVKVEAITSAEYPTPARRPMYSVLDNKGLRERHGYYMKEWKEALVEYIDSIKYSE